MNKTEKQNISIDIFVTDITSITRTFHLSGMRKKHFSCNTKNAFVSDFEN